MSVDCLIKRGLNSAPYWFKMPVNKNIDILTNEQTEEKIGWQHFSKQDTLVEQFKGQIIEISDNIVTIVFKNTESNIGEACQFSLDRFQFEVNVNDFVLLKQYGMNFVFEKYTESVLERIEDRKFAQKIISYEENYDI